MIKEAYVGFEVAKLLKEKGFYEPCLRVYDKNGIICIRYLGFDIPHDYTNRLLYLCPTHQMAMAYLREKYGFHIYTFYENEFHWHYVIDSLTKKWRYSVSENKSNDEAIEAALKYSLENLI